MVQVLNYAINRIVVLVFAGCFLAFAWSSGLAAPEDILSSSYRMKISFTGYNRPETLTNFPALVTLGTNLPGFSYDQCSSPANGSDLRFANFGSSEELNYELEQWDTNTCVASPTNIPGCILWLKADAGVMTDAGGGVTNWIDQSQHGNGVQPVSAGAPTNFNGILNGLPVVRFNGSTGLDTYGNLGMAADSPRTVFMVVKPTSGRGNSEVFGIATGQMLDFGNVSQNNRLRLRNSTDLYTGDGSVPYDGWHIICAIGDAAGTRAWSDAVLKTDVAGKYFNYAMSNDCRVGWTGFATRNYLGDLAELILYTNSLSALEQRQIGWYLTSKYKLQGYSEPGKSHFWVQVPLLSATNWICAYWGNKNATNQPVYTTNGTTWPNDFVGVWHMGQTNAQDSTSNKTHGTSYANMNSTGKIGPGQWFSGSAYIDTGNSALFEFTNNITLSAWVYIDSIVGGNWAGIIDKLQEWSTGYLLGCYPTGTCAMVAYAPTSSWRMAVVSYPTNAWLYMSGTISNGVVSLYTNGVLANSSAAGAGNNISTNSFNLLFGKAANGACYFKGFADELRVENIVRSSNWIWACWLNQASNFTFNIYGTVEKVPGRGTVIRVR